MTAFAGFKSITVPALKTSLALLFTLAVTPAFTQQAGTVSNLPYASTPLNGSELLYVIQNGVSKKTSLSQAMVPAYTSPLAGAVSRSYASKLSDIISIADFGGIASTTTTTCSMSASSTTASLGAAVDFVNGQGFRCTHAGAAFALNAPTAASATPTGTPGSTTYVYTIAAVDAAGGVGAAIATFQTTTGNATLGAVNYNALAWSAPTGTTPAGYAVYRASTLIGFAGSTSFADQGQANAISQDWLPTSPPGAALADDLVTTIVSGAGTTSLTLANAAATAASGQTASHDNTAALQACVASGVKCFLPPGTYNVAGSGGYGVVLPTNVSTEIEGSGRGTASNPAGIAASSPGTTLFATHALTALISSSSAVFSRGHHIRDLTLDGAGVTHRGLWLNLVASSTFESMDILNDTTDNLQVGTASYNAIENQFANLRLDNPLVSNVVPNLPFSSLQVASTNNQFVNVLAVNANAANVYTTPTSANNQFTNVHGYNYSFYSLAATGPAQNFLVEGTGDQFVLWEADGGTYADVDVNGNQNIFIGGISIFASPLASAGNIDIETGACGNTITHNRLSNPTTLYTINIHGTPCAAGTFYTDNVDPVTGGSYTERQSVSVTFANLPACNASNEGATQGVSDGNSTTFHATLAGGSSSHVRAYCNGTNWVVGG